MPMSVRTRKAPEIGGSNGRMRGAAIVRLHRQGQDMMAIGSPAEVSNPAEMGYRSL
jgi:hypothetical protein